MLKKGDIVKLIGSSSLWVFTGESRRTIVPEFSSCNMCYRIGNTCQRCDYEDRGTDLRNRGTDYELMRTDGYRVWCDSEMILANDKKQQFLEERRKYIAQQQQLDDELFELMK